MMFATEYCLRGYYASQNPAAHYPGLISVNEYRRRMQEMAAERLKLVPLSEEAVNLAIVNRGNVPYTPEQEVFILEIFSSRTSKTEVMDRYNTMFPYEDRSYKSLVTKFKDMTGENDPNTSKANWNMVVNPTETPETLVAYAKRVLDHKKGVHGNNGPFLKETVKHLNRKRLELEWKVPRFRRRTILQAINKHL